MPFPIGGPLERSLLIQPFSKRIGVTSLTFQGLVTSSVTRLFDSPCHFLLVVLWNQASVSNGFRDIQHRMSRNG